MVDPSANNPSFDGATPEFTVNEDEDARVEAEEES